MYCSMQYINILNQPYCIVKYTIYYSIPIQLLGKGFNSVLWEAGAVVNSIDIIRYSTTLSYYDMTVL